MIPKVIHYCWFGRKQLPESAQRYIESWKKFCPDYEIKEWNEDNFDLDSFRYAREAYDNHKYAFVSDIVRLYALYNEGGIYMDTDVELTASLDKFLCHNTFLGFEDATHIATAIIGCEKGSLWVKENLEFYKERPFIKPDGTFDLCTNVITITNHMIDKGFKLNNQCQEIPGYCTIYPSDYFCPKDYYTEKIKCTENTHSIHHFSRTWCDEETRWQTFVRRHPHFNQFRLIPNKIGMILLGDSYKKLKVFFKRK